MNIPESDAITFLASVLGKDWRNRVITFLAVETTPFISADFGESFDISSQSANACCTRLVTLDLLTCYAKKNQKNTGFEVSGDGTHRRYFLLGDLIGEDKEFFVPSEDVK